MKKIINLVVYIHEESNKVDAQLKHRCVNLDSALDIIEDFVNRKRKKGGKADA